MHSEELGSRHPKELALNVIYCWCSRAQWEYRIGDQLGRDKPGVPCSRVLRGCVEIPDLRARNNPRQPPSSCIDLPCSFAPCMTAQQFGPGPRSQLQLSETLMSENILTKVLSPKWLKEAFSARARNFVASFNFSPTIIEREVAGELHQFYIGNVTGKSWYRAKNDPCLR